MLVQCGIKLDMQTQLIIDSTLIHLANLYKAKRIKFWGKYLGKQDYYVIQGTSGLIY